MHLTLKKETATPPAGSLRRQQERFDEFLRVFNEERPHEALGMATPASLYQASPRAYPEHLVDPEYPCGWMTRQVDSGRFRWHSENVFVSHVLHGERLGLEPLDERHWRLWFGPMALGVFDGYVGRVLEGRAASRSGLDASLLRSSFRSAPGASQEP